MSKNNESVTATVKNPQVEELTANGTVMLKAKSRKELAGMVAALVRDAAGYSLSYSPVGENYAEGTFCQRISVVPKK